MYIDWDVIIKVGAVITALAAIFGVVIFVVKWFNKQNKQSTDIEELRKKHEADIKAENQDIQSIRNELCVLSYGMLAALDGLKQLHCNGEVTKAHDMLSKHLNQQAHCQNKD